MKKIDFTTVCLIIVFLSIIILVTLAYIFFWFKNGYPVEVTVAVIGTCLTEIVLLCRLVINKRKYKGVEDDKTSECEHEQCVPGETSKDM